MVRTYKQHKKTLQIVLENSGKPLLYLITFLVSLFIILTQLFTKIIQSIKLRPHFKLKLPKIHIPIKKITLPSVTWKKATLIILIISTLYNISTYFKSLPSPHELSTRSPSLSTKIYDRNGKLLYKIYKDENRTLISLDKLPSYVIESTLAAEDKNFYNHIGISISGIIRATRNNITKKTVQGGSTITQQLVKNTLLTPEKTIERKIKEAILSLWTETIFTKEEILEMYLNEVPYGGTAYGIEEAAQQYFGKSAYSLNLEEASLLAGLPTAPTTLSPYGAQPYEAKKRQEQVLTNMVDAEFISNEQKNKALNQPLTLQANNIEILAPHFVMYVREYLANKYSEELINQGGLEVHTTLDYEMNQILQNNIAQELDGLKKLHVTNGAGLITNPKTGEILAMVGSKNFFDFEEDGQVNVTLQPRQPGSSIKPITYALAFSNGYSPSTAIIDEPVIFTIPGQEPYKPRNYDGKYHGKITLRTALASSYNIPALKLLNQLEIDNMINLARQMGITTWEDPSRFGLSLTLGGGEVKMTDMAEVYGTFANTGINIPINPIREIINHERQVLENNTCRKEICNGERLLSPLVAFQINDILSDPSARSPAFGLNSVLNIANSQVAVKTGTSNNLRDNWTIGYTEELLIAVWVGNNDNTPMSQVASGITGASPIWAKTMTRLLNSKKTYAFHVPDNIQKLFICPTTNTLYCKQCPSQGKWEYFVPGTEPKSSCTEESIGKILDTAASTKKEDSIPTQ